MDQQRQWQGSLVEDWLGLAWLLNLTDDPLMFWTDQQVMDPGQQVMDPDPCWGQAILISFPLSFTWKFSRWKKFPKIHPELLHLVSFWSFPVVLTGSLTTCLIHQPKQTFFVSMCLSRQSAGCCWNDLRWMTVQLLHSMKNIMPRGWKMHLWQGVL